MTVKLRPADYRAFSGPIEPFPEAEDQPDILPWRATRYVLVQFACRNPDDLADGNVHFLYDVMSATQRGPAAEWKWNLPVWAEHYGYEVAKPVQWLDIPDFRELSE